MINRQSYYIRSLLASLLTITLHGCMSPPEKSRPATELEQAATESSQKNLSAKQADQLAQAIVHLNNGDYDDAKKLLLQIQRSTSNTSVLSNLALTYYKLGDLESADIFARKAIQAAPDQAQTYNLAGTISLDLRHFQTAEKFFKQALELNDDYALAHYNLAILYDIYYQDIDSAYAHYLKYLALIDFEDKQTLEWVDQLKYSINQD